MEKVEVEEKRIEDSTKMVKGETLPRPYQSSSEQTQESLRIINEETSQLSEFLLQEGKLIRELCVLLRHILKRLKMHFKLPTNVFSQTWKTQRIILTDEAHLVFVNNRNEVKSKALEDYPPKVILNVASFIIPELSKTLTSYREDVSSRIDMFDKINQELRSLRNTLANRQKNLEEDVNPAGFGVKKILLTKHAVSSEENKRNTEST
ncbi:MAG: hypothetical protein O2U62_02610 [Candidatus Bathyarchaeota archaeon]|nr:hypothetical protein [Candidatus Bathyarchaeota archaeon]